jgi:hypothetical protein
LNLNNKKGPIQKRAHVSRINPIPAGLKEATKNKKR